MRNYYDVLEISTDSNKGDIKRAYFKKVREFPPDKYEEEFRNIREAYEFLSDDEKKKNYDKIFFLPDNIKQLYNKGNEALDSGNEKQAIKIFEQIFELTKASNIDGFSTINEILADCYFYNGNYGKSASVLLKILDEDKNNLFIKEKLAYSYINRSWHKKARVIYKEIISVDKNMIKSWIGLSETYILSNEIRKAKKVLDDCFVIHKDITVANKLIILDAILLKFKDFENHFDFIKKNYFSQDDLEGEISNTLMECMPFILDNKKYGLANEIIDFAAILEDEVNVSELKEIVKEYQIFDENMKKLADDSRIHDFILDFIDYELKHKFIPLSPETFSEKMNLEMELVLNADRYRSSIRILKNYYRDVFNICSYKFSDLLSKRASKRVALDMMRHLQQFTSILDDDDDDYYDDDEYPFGRPIIDDDDDEEPYVRELPKVGRNDACPCGSGKKFKKCCMDK